MRRSVALDMTRSWLKLDLGTPPSPSKFKPHIFDTSLYSEDHMYLGKHQSALCISKLFSI